jgi:hypothetical protein
MLSRWFGYVPDVANWASIVSLFVAGYAAYAITKVRAQIVDRIRLPSLVAVLESHGKKFATLMRSYHEEGTRELFVLELAKCEANVRLVRSKMSRSKGGRATLLLRQIARYKGPRWFGYSPAITDREQAWKIYADLIGLIEELKNVVEEQKMGA